MINIGRQLEKKKKTKTKLNKRHDIRPDLTRLISYCKITKLRIKNLNQKKQNKIKNYYL